MHKLLGLIIVTLLISSCNNSSGYLVRYPVEATYVNRFTDPFVTTYYAQIQADGEAKGEMSVHSFSKDKGMNTIEGVSVHSYDIKTIVTLDEKIIDENVLTEHITLDPFSYIASVSKDEYGVITEQKKLPETAIIGESNKFYTLVKYADATKKDKINIQHARWSLTKATESTAWFCEDIEVEYFKQDEANYTVSYCDEIDDEGNIISQKMIHRQDATDNSPKVDLTLTSEKPTPTVS